MAIRGRRRPSRIRSLPGPPPPAADLPLTSAALARQRHAALRALFDELDKNEEDSANVSDLIQARSLAPSPHPCLLP